MACASTWTKSPAAGRFDADRLRNGSRKRKGSSRRLVSANVQESHRVAFTSLVPGAAYGVSFLVTDPYGNARGGELNFTAPLRPDTEPPQLLSLPVALNVSEAGARIGVGYNEDVQLSVRYYPT